MIDGERRAASTQRFLTDDLLLVSLQLSCQRFCLLAGPAATGVDVACLRSCGIPTLCGQRVLPLRSGMTAVSSQRLGQLITSFA